MPESEIVEGLFVGDFLDGTRLLAEGWPTLCVLEARPDPAPDTLMWIPVLRTFGVPPYIQAIPGQLDAAAAVIQTHQHHLIVHCGAGVERFR